MPIDLYADFGYPILRPLIKYNDEDTEYGIAPKDQDYVGDHFDTSPGIAEHPTDPNISILSWEITFNIPRIKNLVTTGDIVVIGKSSCRDTLFSESFEIELTKEFESCGVLSGEREIKSDDLSGLHTFEIFLLANSDITIESDEINPDFGYTEFSLRKGQLVGWGEPVTDLAKRNKVRKPGASLFELEESPNFEKSEYTINYESDHISIIVSNELLKKINLIKASHPVQGPIRVNNLIYAPALTSVLHSIGAREEEFEQYTWFQEIEKKLQPASMSIKTTEPEKIAQRLFQYPLLMEGV